MHKELLVLLLFAGVASAAVKPTAQTAPATGQTGGGASTADRRSTVSSVTTLSVRGTIDTYDRVTRMLVLTTPTGSVQFPVAPTTRIRQGWHKVDPFELPALAGDRATVRYTESGDRKIVESVHVFGK